MNKRSRTIITEPEYNGNFSIIAKQGGAGGEEARAKPDVGG